jgi:hypothetical protein
MKNIYDSIKTIQNKPPVSQYRPPSIDEDYEDYYDDYDYSDDEGTAAPIDTTFFTNTSTTTATTQLEEPYSKLLTGYTNENVEIDVNKPNAILNKIKIIIFKHYFRSNRCQLICLVTKIGYSIFVIVVVQLVGTIPNGRVHSAAV